MNRLRIFSGLVTLITSAGVLMGKAADAPYAMEPELPLAFPFAQRSDGVGLQYPVMISPTVILPVNVTLRVMYIQPKGDDQAIRRIQRKSEQEVAYSNRKAATQRPENERPKNLQEQAALLIARETVWPKVANFQLAFAQMPSNDLRLVYYNPQTSSLVNEALQFPEGMLLAEQNGHVVVLAAEKTGPAATAGIHAQDKLLEWAGYPTNGTLAGFSQAYLTSRKSSGLSSTDTFPVKLLREGNPEPQTVQVRRPISLQSSLMDMPVDASTNQNKAEEKPKVPLLY